MDIQVKNDALEKRNGWWEWSIWLEGPDDQLDQVDYVEYILHSTFKDPIQRVSNRATRFRLRASGWGEFNVYVKIRLKDGQVLERQHWLAFDVQATHKEMAAERFASGQKPRLYLSSSAGDALFAGALQDALEAQDIEIVVNHELSAGQELEPLLASGREHFDAGLFVISEIRNPWLGREVEVLQRHNVPLLAVQIGDQARLPEALKGAPTYPIKDVSEASMVAEAIAARIREQL